MVRLSVAVFGNLKCILRNVAITNNLKTKAYEICVTPVMLYKMEIVTFLQSSATNYDSHKRQLDGQFLGLSLRHRVLNKEIRQRTGVTDLISRIS